MSDKYRKKPIVVTAHKVSERVVIQTPEGDMAAEPGDYIITGVKGEKYPCKPDIFKTTYEPVEKMDGCDKVRECAERLMKAFCIFQNDEDENYKKYAEQIETELRALVDELCTHAHHEGVTDTISAAVDAAIKAEDKQKADTLEARLVRLAGKHGKIVIEKYKDGYGVYDLYITEDGWEYSRAININSMEATISEAVAAAEREVGDG